MRRPKKEAEHSYELEDEPLCLEIVRGGTVVLCGTQEGTVAVYKWGEWEDCVDRIKGHPSSVDSIAAIADDVVCTASSDGMIRVLKVLPHSLLGVLGEHEGFPIERVRASPDRSLIASCSHDKLIRFWSTGHYAGGAGGGARHEPDAADGMEATAAPAPGGGGGFFADL